MLLSGEIFEEEEKQPFRRKILLSWVIMDLEFLGMLNEEKKASYFGEITSEIVNVLNWFFKIW